MHSESRRLGSTEVDVRGSGKSREISAVDMYAAPTKNVHNSTNIDPFDLIRKWGHDTTILYLSNSSFELMIANGSASNLIFSYVRFGPPRHIFSFHTVWDAIRKFAQKKCTRKIFGPIPRCLKI